MGVVSVAFLEAPVVWSRTPSGSISGREAKPLPYQQYGATY